MHQVSKIGFSLGSHVVCKGADVVQVFELVAITEESATLLERGLVMTSEPTSLTIGPEQLTCEWKPFKGKIVCPLKGWSPELTPLSCEEFCWEVFKGRILHAMSLAYGENAKVSKHLWPTLDTNVKC